MRCAIYTRKSVDDRGDAQLTSTDRQREMCLAYVDSQPGWAALPDVYEDVGFSGGTVARPALQALLAEVTAGRVDMILVYKIDRLSRSLRDFVNLMDVLTRSGVSFVSITQSFSTADSMGRLMMNVLLSFAQFEREMVGERTRDWKAGARARGLWTSGPPPYGYRLDNLKLRIDEDRAAVVRRAYRLLPKLKSYTEVAAVINAAGHRNRLGRPFDGRAIKAMVVNRLYRGEMPHRGVSVPGSHAAIVTEAAWRKARSTVETMDARHGAKSGRPRRIGGQ